jgi:hypothetical protein
MTAAYNGHVATVRLLAERADLNLQDEVHSSLMDLNF